DRVRLYEEIARQDANLFARFKALQRIDAIDGIIPDIDRLKVERRHEGTPRVPIFNLPLGARIAVNPTYNIQVNNTTKSPDQGSTPESPEVRDITPRTDGDSGHTN